MAPGLSGDCGTKKPATVAEICACLLKENGGGGMRPGTTLGESDDLGFNVTRDRVHVRDLHATILNQLGFDHTRLSVKFQGLDQRLTGVEPARVVREILT